MEGNHMERFMTEVTGKIISTGEETTVGIDKYAVVTDSGELYISGFSHADLLKLVSKLMAVGMEQAVLYTYAAHNDFDAGDVHDEVTKDVAGMYNSTVDYDGSFA
jgi:hypothetical protein